MKLQDLQPYRKQLYKMQKTYYTELFSKAIWGDMGEDCASIILTAKEDEWHLHYIRTQSGEPYPLSESICNIIDEYDKILNDEQLFDVLSMHQKIDEFMMLIEN